MKYDELEARLHMPPGQISAILMSTSPLYKSLVLRVRRKVWKTGDDPKTRTVMIPCPELKDVQRQIHRVIAGPFQPHPIVHAYVKGRGIVTNARQHVGKEWLLHADLVNFFGSITEELVVEALRKALPDFSNEDRNSIARLCCYEGFLPQGSPASPILSNLVCFPLDQRLQKLGKSLGLTVTRYSDDVCFSSPNPVFPDALGKVRGRGAAQLIEIGAPLGCLFKPHGFEINLKKLRFQDRTERQQVTGLVVNDGVNVPKECYRTIRQSLHLWDERGLEIAARHVQWQSSLKRFAASLKGMIAHIGHVTGPGNTRYQDFFRAYENLRTRDLERLKLA